MWFQWNVSPTGDLDLEITLPKTNSKFAPENRTSTRKETRLPTSNHPRAQGPDRSPQIATGDPLSQFDRSPGAKNGGTDFFQFLGGWGKVGGSWGCWVAGVWEKARFFNPKIDGFIGVKVQKSHEWGFSEKWHRKGQLFWYFSSQVRNKFKSKRDCGSVWFPIKILFVISCESQQRPRQKRVRKSSGQT